MFEEFPDKPKGHALADLRAVGVAFMTLAEKLDLTVP